jgi:UDP-2-acetamido-3-amino-2,3-dideoxy-glucuronate N-acetyltransferase
MSVNIHPSSVVDAGATIGDFTSIWHFCHIEPRAVIGENNNLGQNVYVGNDATIGNACRIGNGVSIFSHVVLEDFVFCAPFMVFTHIFYPRAAVTRKNVFATTRVKTGATIGANATVVPAVTVGAGAFIAAGAVLTASCLDWSLMVGSPARHVGWVSAFGDKMPLPLEGRGEWQCPESGDIYRLEGKTVTRVAGPNDILCYEPGVRFTRHTGRRDGGKS